MAKTKISDVIVPEVFAPYVINRTKELSVLIQSGIAVSNPLLDNLVTQGGKLINMPFWKALTGEDEVLSDETPLTPEKITTGADVAALLTRGKAWSSNQLAGALAGSDPMAAIADQVAVWRGVREQNVLISILTGIFGSAISNHINDISGETGDAAIISPGAILDTKQLLGDAADQFTALAMHSAVYTELQKQDLITFVPNSQGIHDIPMYGKYRVLVDDACPVTSGVYSTYLFADGAFGRGDGLPSTIEPVETDKDILAGNEVLVNNWAFVLHPFGVKWKNASVAGATPSNAELAMWRPTGRRSIPTSTLAWQCSNTKYQRKGGVKHGAVCI